MRHRHAISDEDWERIKDLLPGKEGDPGATARDNRLFIDAVLWAAKTGAPWRDLPERFGSWNSVWKRFSRWARKGRGQGGDRGQGLRQQGRGRGGPGDGRRGGDPDAFHPQTAARDRRGSV